MNVHDHLEWSVSLSHVWHGRCCKGLKSYLLFAAIRFVIDSFDGNEGSSPESRQRLLHVCQLLCPLHDLHVLAAATQCDLCAQNFNCIHEVYCLRLPAAVFQEGTGHAVQQAWVELVFDNSDRRLGVCYLS
jgi:hypothetical protein